MTLSTTSGDLRLPHFSPDHERSFQTGYYIRVRPTLRLVSGFLSGTLGLYTLLSAHEPMAFVGVFNIPQLLLCLLIFGLTWAPTFERMWQPVLVLTSWVAAMMMFGALASMMVAHPPPVTDMRAGLIILRVIFTLQVCVFMVTVATFRLTFLPTLALQCGVVLVGAVAFVSHFTMGGERGHALLQFLEPVLVVLLAVLLTSFVQEKLARGAFEFNRRVSELQIQEHTMRLETEKMLHVLNGAIGGIVHDLGNPLTTVQSGAELTKEVLGDENTDLKTLGELNNVVLRGARMLGYLRTSLIEQSRVLEGKPVPVELKPVSVRYLVESGASFQQQHFSSKRPLIIEGDDLCICADEMKMVTVLMNLIGNALKYSDGEIRVRWQIEGKVLRLDVSDAGKAEQGLSQKQAGRLFAPFTRLEEHSNIEGTGLGLMSVRKIIEAHGGEVWLEGFSDGSADSPAFSTATHNLKPQIASPFRTSFVITCPLSG
ncbi:HAMP domain-containing histidine kinase [bacterium]|nr:MAG: HAMP domain-containing histidine kinase [bacterium]